MSTPWKITLDPSKISAPKNLNDHILAGKNRGSHTFDITFFSASTYANILAPIAGIVDHYGKEGLSIALTALPHSYIAHTHVCDPFIAETAGQTSLDSPLDKVWRFYSSKGINALVDAVLLYVRKADVVQPGVLNSIEWCLNEVMDNILQHSEVGYGFFMGQLHRTNKRFSFCIFDSGIGLFNSLKNSKHHPHTPLDAITLALQERVTRDENIGQGNGLWGLTRIIHESQGLLRIVSGGAKYEYSDGQEKTIRTGEFNLGRANGTVLVDVQLDYSKEINIDRALNGYEPIDIWMEEHETEQGEFIIKIADESAGTGTRKAAEQIRNMAMNIVIQEKKKCIFDFSGVNVISSSYADELLGKLVVKIGISHFMSNFSFINMNQFCTTIINRSVQQRMAQKYYGASIDESETE